MKPPNLLYSLAAAVALAACGGSGASSSPEPGSNAVDSGAESDSSGQQPEAPAVPDETTNEPSEEAGAADTPDTAAPDAAVPSDPSLPPFPDVSVYSTVIDSSGDPADVYYPSPPDLQPGAYAFPMALLLQGANVDKQYYGAFARGVASYGFVVMVPNHESMSMTGTGLFMETKVVSEALAAMKSENAAATPIQGLLDTARFVLLGHSYGGVVGLQALQGQCTFPFCMGSFERPAELAGGAFYGTNTKGPIGGVTAVANDAIAVAYVQGDLDGKASLHDTEQTYAQTADPPKSLVRVQGANHYGICDVNNPSGAQQDSNVPALAQSAGIETIARWSALFLRAYALGDPSAAHYVQDAGDAADPNVTVESTP